MHQTSLQARSPHRTGTVFTKTHPQSHVLKCEDRSSTEYALSRDGIELQNEELALGFRYLGWFGSGHIKYWGHLQPLESDSKCPPVKILESGSSLAESSPLLVEHRNGLAGSQQDSL